MIDARWKWIKKPETPGVWAYWIYKDGTCRAICETEEYAKHIVEGLNRDEYRNGKR
jgi:hypothetical protein